MGILQLYKVDEGALKADMGEKRKQHLFPDLWDLPYICWLYCVLTKYLVLNS